MGYADTFIRDSCNFKNNYMSISVFISYSQKDEYYKKALEAHLTILQRLNVIATWSDRKITAGDNWEQEINLNLEKSKIVLLLISANFLSSDYCYDTETIFALEQHNNGKAIVLPIIIKPCLWQKSNFGHLQAFPSVKPISLWKNKDEAWLSVTNEIVKVIEKFNLTRTGGDASNEKLDPLFWTGAGAFIGFMLIPGLGIPIGAYLGRSLEESKRFIQEDKEI